jgi:hypothetical protein
MNVHQAKRIAPVILAEKLRISFKNEVASSIGVPLTPESSAKPASLLPAGQIHHCVAGHRISTRVLIYSYE